MCYRFQYSTLGSHLIRQNLADAEFEDVTLKANKRLKPSQIHQLKHELKPLVISTITTMNSLSRELSLFLNGVLDENYHSTTSD